ncbi:GntR family transcriptional regulator [Saccharopolyspora cebuensis]|uniref:GntR family transcriptional regulator n=1 Tax=Saccharopolyspora cebuensis TaxID=418759 RepID=A0ABV4CR45_9PSEU
MTRTSRLRPGRAESGGSLTEAVMDHVRTSVIDGSMRPGEWYSAYQLAEELGISRSPVREGLLRLEEAGLVEFVRRRGFRIVPTTPEDVAEIFSIRIALEVPAAERAALANAAGWAQDAAELRAAMVAAAERDEQQLFFEIDQQLHALILDAGAMPRSRRLIDQLRTSTRLLGASTAGDKRGYSDIIEEHDPIVSAILDGAAAAAGDAMRAHLVTTGVLLVAQALERAGRDEDPGALWDRLTAGFAR